MRRILLTVVFLISVLLSATAGFGQSKSIGAAARKDIDAGNQAWIDAMKGGDMAPVADAFAEDALSCGPSGACEKGRAAIEASLKARVAKTGKAVSATVTSVGSVQRGNFVYEWGESWATYPDGHKAGGNYLTVWEREADGRWRIYRNLGMPATSGKK
ncbi:MAG TPA: SgcJ/EcaC family oxidoreductase [Candidatus Acidoferrales bacterium]|nr:SgcJ/EcaC family oxidoreductase [Candidatus Acidoferrales bacterium]